MKCCKGFAFLALGVMLLCAPSAARAARAGLVLGEPVVSAAPDFLEARQYHIANGRVAGSLSARQNVTAWQVIRGSWQGQSLDGLSLVLVQTIAEDGQSPAMVNCYISHLATIPQRKALLSAYLGSVGSEGGVADPSNWRIEPAVIRLEFAGQTVIIHLGAVA
jgi:hypothetical protein